MTYYDQRLFFDNESGQKTLYPGSNSSILRIEVKGSCKVYGKLFKQSDAVLLAGINASTYAPTTDFTDNLFSVEVSGYQELIVVSTQKSTISVKLIY